MRVSSTAQRQLLLSFILSLSLCGLVGIYVLLIGSFGWFESRVLGSTAAIGAASILAMASAVAWETRRWHPIGPAGCLAVAAALLLVLGLIWDAYPRTQLETFGRVIASAVVAAVALPHAGLLSLARLHRGHEWVRYGTLACIAALASVATVVIWGGLPGDAIVRAMGVLAILVVCGTVAVPILHRVARLSDRTPLVTTEALVSLTCPRCGAAQRVGAGWARCACGLRLRVEIEEEHCPACGYSLYRATGNACPECGAPRAQ